MSNGTAPPPDSRSRRSRLVLILLLVLLILALSAVLVVIGVRHLSGTSKAKATPSHTGTALSSSVAQPSAGRTTGGTASAPTARTTRPPSTAPTKKAAPIGPVVSVRAAVTVRCAVPPEDAPGASTPPDPPVTISWSSTGATKAWFGIQTDNAQAEPYSQVDPRGSITVVFPCPTAQQRYTITVVGAGRAKASRSVVVRNVGYVR